MRTDPHKVLHVARSGTRGFSLRARDAVYAAHVQPAGNSYVKRGQLNSLGRCGQYDRGRGAGREPGPEQPAWRGADPATTEFERHVSLNLHAVGMARHYLRAALSMSRGRSTVRKVEFWAALQDSRHALQSLRDVLHGRGCPFPCALMREINSGCLGAHGQEAR